MWTSRFNGTQRHSGRHFNAVKGTSRRRFDTEADPIFSFHFKLEIGGITFAHFQEVSGLNYETEVFPFREGGVNEYEHKLMGQAKFTNLVIKNGMTTSRDLWNWRMQAINNRSAARKKSDVSIALRGLGGKDIQRWQIFGAWPCKWEGPQFNSTQSALAFEKIEIAYTYFTVG